MKVYRDIEDFNCNKPVVLTQGTFDGVHFGHRKILQKVVADAKSIGGESVLLTFYPHPRLVLYPADNDLKLLNTLNEKSELVQEIGIDHLVVLPFTKKLSRLKPEFFVRDILVNKLHVQKLIIGYDHRFGRNREGSLEDMIRFSKEYGFTVEEISAQDVDQSIVSSTKIRKALLAGDVHHASEWLGRPYKFQGEVVHGMNIGHDLGYPTANIKIESEYKLVPKNGVYAVKVKVLGKEWRGMLNIGYNPTFTDKNWSIEVHIFEFHKNIYNQSVEIAFVQRMRDELKFNSKEELIQQLKLDEINAKKILNIN
ncbi:bifunctional riboflavin kinase/FAD synthetase [bacterium]|nr:bifunctional riboflavin kinase/FAD synthetase [bacterium]